MIDFSTYCKSLVYLAFCYSAVTASYPIPHQGDHQTNLAAAKSSPYAHNGTEQLYSEWSQWTKCSSTCGLGIITRTRTCLKRAYNAKGVYVPLCHAEYSEHKICHLKSCPLNAPEPREIQCSQHNNRTVGGKLVPVWIPASNSPNPCELRCKGKTEDMEYGFGKVSNGTPCPQGVCLDGRCLRIGCDDRLGSEVVLDMCGVCGGRNASCVHYKDVYMGQPPADSERRNGYHEVVVLPIGARNIIIRQLVSKNYLALQDRTRGIIFNGEQHLTKYGGHYDIAGTRIQFEKSDNTTEILTANGPVTEELYVLVLLRAFNQGIYYEYWLPKQSHNPVRNQYPVHRIDNESFTTTTTTTAKPVLYTTSPNFHHRHHPTKPAFAYGYGEKPYPGQDAPVFRHFTTSTTSTPRNILPSVQQPHAEAQYRPYVNSDYGSIGIYKKNSNPLYKPRTYASSGGYYQTFRNESSGNVKKISDLDKELPVLTQPDFSERIQYDTVIPNSVLDEAKHELFIPKSQKPLRVGTGISKRGDKAINYVTNGRLKYSIETKDADGVYVNTSGRYTPAPLSIALLPSPDEDRNKSGKGTRKGEGRPKKPRLTRGGSCGPCERSRDQTKHFCESDFVIKGLVIGYEFLHGETRYEIEVKQTFKNTLSLLPKEYVWSPDTCRCPKLRPGKEYVIMGKIDNNYRKRESRLLVDKTCFVRTFNLKYARRLQKLRKDYTKKCTKTS